MSQPSHPDMAIAADLSWVSWLRVVAIAAVVLIHVAGPTAVAPDARETSVGWLAISLDFSSRWAVPVFVMLSGTLLLDPERYRGAADFLRRRAARLIPAVIVWHLVYLCYLLFVTDSSLTVADAPRLILTGKVWTALYFFWIVLGLAVITPVLVPWIAASSPRVHLVVGLSAALLPALNVLSEPIRNGQGWRADMAWVETPWTWWIPYLGYYMLGYALRGVVLRRAALLGPAAMIVAGSALLSWQWGKTDGAAGIFERFVPAESYQSVTAVLVAVSVFLLAQGTIRPGGLLSGLCHRGPALAGRSLGDATLGVFAVHLLVFEAVLRLPGIGGPTNAGSVTELVARCLFVLVGAYLVSLVATRVPLVRRVF